MHLNFIVAVWRKGKKAEEKFVVETTPQGLQKLAQLVGEDEVWAAYEASSCGFEVYDLLTARGWKVFVLAPTHIARSVRGRKRKTDLEDARRILEVLMSHGELGGRLPAVWVPSRKIREDRELVRRRLTVAEELARVKCEIGALLRIQQVKGPEGLKKGWTKKHRAWLRGLAREGSALAPSVRKALGSLVRQLEFLAEEVETLQKEVEELAQEEAYRKPVEKMTEVEGVGTLTAVTYYLELGDPKRFKNRRQVGSYLGLVPTSYESGDEDDRKGHISRMGPARVRKVLNQATLARLRLEPDWRKRYKPIAVRRGPKKAIVAMMRKLGIELWRKACAA